MKINQIDILKNLAWDSTAEQKKSGFIAALNQTDHRYLLQPINYSSSWENCAIVFLMLSDEEIEPYLIGLLGWIQDLNWAGARLILERLQRISSELLVKPLEIVAKSAFDIKDESWLGWISILIAKPNMIALLDDEILNLLKPYAIEYWKWDYEKILKDLQNKNIS